MRKNAVAGLAFEPRVRPFRVEYQDMPCVVWAASAGRARYLAAVSLHDAGYLNRANPAAIRAIRDRSLDHLTLAAPGRCYGYDQLPSA